MFESVQVKPLCCWYTGSEGWFYTGSGLSVTCMQMYEHEVGGYTGRGISEQSRNFTRIPGIFHAVQEFRTHSRNFARIPGILQFFQTYCTRKRDSTIKEKIFAKKL
jgi:hypothetical protein